MRRVALWMVLLLMVAGCSWGAPEEATLRWNGTAVEGMKFRALETGRVTVHYPAADPPEGYDAMGEAVEQLLSDQESWGRTVKGDVLHLWAVPAGKVPAGLPEMPVHRQVRAAAPLVLVGDAGALTADSQRAGLTEAVAVAVSQGPDSPAYIAGWTHEGLGGLWATSMRSFPVGDMQRGAAVKDGAAGMIKLLTEPPDELTEEYQIAAKSLATLLIDRWGFFLEGIPASPVEALMGATGAPDQTAAVALWQERLDQARGHNPQMAFPLLADMSPIRVTPKLEGRPAGTSPSDNYSPHRYDLAVRYDPDRRTISGEERLTWQNGEGIVLDTLYLNLWPNSVQYAQYGGAIQVTGVEVDGKPARFTARGLDLTVELGRRVEHGQEAAVVIRFTTRLPHELTTRVFGQNSSGRFNLAHWFPILAPLDERGWNLHAMPLYPGEPYSENASFTVELDVPAGVAVAATGRQTGREEQGDRWVYRYEAPDVRDWVATGGKNLKEAVHTEGSVTIRGVDESAEAALMAARETGRALQLFEEHFGPYPYSDLVVVTCCAGLEYPGLFFTVNPVGGPPKWRAILYHELAHQWFYGVVGNDQYAEAWLDEGFALYAERFALRALGYPELMAPSRASQAPPVPINSSADTFAVKGNFGPAVYHQGAAALEALEAELGAPVFRQVLQAYVKRFQFKTATTADFVRVAEEVSGRDLKEFFRSQQIEPGLREAPRAVVPLGTTKPR